MDIIRSIITGELIVALALLIILLILIIWLLLRKIVVVATLTVVTDKLSYSRAETVQITGSLTSDGTPLPSETVALAIKPPVGDVFSLPSVITDAAGNYVSSWLVPDDVDAGSYELTATALGVSVTTTFTL